MQSEFNIVKGFCLIFYFCNYFYHAHGTSPFVRTLATIPVKNKYNVIKRLTKEKLTHLSNSDNFTEESTKEKSLKNDIFYDRLTHPG